MAQTTRHLLIIDPQNDFCDLPPAYCPPLPGGQSLQPALPVAGAHADMQRLAALIDAGGAVLDAITVTLDSHHHLDIAHPTFWQQADGSPVTPFTPIRAADLADGRYLPRPGLSRRRAQAYLDALEANGRCTHMVWPTHCEIGTWGHAIHIDLQRACNRWEEARTAIVDMLCKGDNPWTEHFSALAAEVPDPTDAGSQFNTRLLERLLAADRVYIAGEAGSHCVRASVEHIATRWPAEALDRLVLIADCISPVGGFETAYTEFLAAIRARGMRVETSAEVRAELRAALH